MKKMKKNLEAILGLALSVSACEGVPEENVSERKFYETRISDISKNLVALTTSLDKYKDNGEKDGETFSWMGRGFVIGKKVFTLDHVVSKYTFEYRVPFGGFMIERINRERIKEDTYLEGIKLHPLIEDNERDVAVFDLSKTLELCEKYCNDLTLEEVVVRKEGIYPGMRVFWSGNPRNYGNFYNEAMVSRNYEDEIQDKSSQESFYINMWLIPGDSGTPIYTEINGRNKIAGVAQRTWQGLGGIKFMDEFAKIIQERENEELKRVNESDLKVTNIKK